MLRGTTLISLATDDGILMAADRLVYAVVDGQAVPRHQGFPKVFATGSNILIGSAGMMIIPEVRYHIQDWIAEFVQPQESAPAKRPDEIATALREKLRMTFQATETSPEAGGWKGYGPSEWLVSYAVAGYAGSFNRPYLFELGVQVDKDGRRLVYPPPLSHSPKDRFWIGEDQHLQRAIDGIDPEVSAWMDFYPRVSFGDHLPNTPAKLKDAVARIVSLIKVEAHFNSNRVGESVLVGIVDRCQRQAYTSVL